MDSIESNNQIELEVRNQQLELPLSNLLSNQLEVQPQSNSTLVVEDSELSSNNNSKRVTRGRNGIVVPSNLIKEDSIYNTSLSNDLTSSVTSKSNKIRIKSKVGPRWTKEEDELLLSLIQISEPQPLTWIEISERMNGTRKSSGVMMRWYNHLRALQPHVSRVEPESSKASIPISCDAIAASAASTSDGTLVSFVEGESASTSNFRPTIITKQRRSRATKESKPPKSKKVKEPKVKTNKYVKLGEEYVLPEFIENPESSLLSTSNLSAIPLSGLILAESRPIKPTIRAARIPSLQPIIQPSLTSSRSKPVKPLIQAYTTSQLESEMGLIVPLVVEKKSHTNKRWSEYEDTVLQSAAITFNYDWDATAKAIDPDGIRTVRAYKERWGKIDRLNRQVEDEESEGESDYGGDSDNEWKEDTYENRRRSKSRVVEEVKSKVAPVPVLDEGFGLKYHGNYQDEGDEGEIMDEDNNIDEDALALLGLLNGNQDSVPQPYQLPAIKSWTSVDDITLTYLVNEQNKPLAKVDWNLVANKLMIGASPVDIRTRWAYMISLDKKKKIVDAVGDTSSCLIAENMPIPGTIGDLLFNIVPLAQRQQQEGATATDSSVDSNQAELSLPSTSIPTKVIWDPSFQNNSSTLDDFVPQMKYIRIAAPIRSRPQPQPRIKRVTAPRKSSTKQYSPLPSPLPSPPSLPELSLEAENLPSAEPSTSITNASRSPSIEPDLVESNLNEIASTPSDANTRRSSMTVDVVEDESIPTPSDRIIRGRRTQIPNSLAEISFTPSGKQKKVHTCPAINCSAAFKRSEHLKRHYRTVHVGSRPFPCQWNDCVKTFSRSDNLSQHMSTVHGVHPSEKIARAVSTSTSASNSLGNALAEDESIYDEDLDADYDEDDEDDLSIPIQSSTFNPASFFASNSTSKSNLIPFGTIESELNRLSNESYQREVVVQRKRSISSVLGYEYNGNENDLKRRKEDEFQSFERGN